MKENGGGDGDGRFWREGNDTVERTSFILYTVEFRYRNILKQSVWFWLGIYYFEWYFTLRLTW